MTDTQALAMLALRRVCSRKTISAAVGSPNGGDAGGSTLDISQLTGGDLVALGRVLRRAIDRTWLTLELLFCQDAVAPRLGRGGEAALEAVFNNRCFDHLTATPAPFRKTIWRELHAARKAGPLAQGDVDVEDIVRKMSGLTHPSDSRAIQDLEWYALWQMAAELSREGYRELRTLFETRAANGESLLIGLVTSFVPFELEIEGNPPRSDFGFSILPDEHIHWLCENSEPVEVLLNEEYGGGRSGPPVEAVARVRQGLTYAQQGEYERAVIEFTAAIQSDLTLAAPYVHRGDALRLRGEYERAIADYTQALRIDPNNLLAFLNRGLVNRLTGRPDEAVADLSEALRLDPRNVVALNGRGAAHADLGRYDLAVADHSQALRLDPALAWAYQSRGDAYAGRQEYDRAIADYTQALRLNPHFPLAHANRGNAYRLAGDLERAAADFTEALRLDPLNPRMYISRADAYRRQQRFDLALSDCGEAIRLDPTNPAGYLNRGITYQLAEDYDHAVADFDRAEQFDSANPEIFYQRARAHQHQRSYAEAIADLDRAIELNPRDAVAFVSRGTLYALLAKLEPAIADFSEAIRLDPSSAQALLERGRVRAMQGEFAGALSDCADAIQLDPQLVPAMLIRGGVFIRMANSDAALVEFNRAIATNPRYARAYNDRGVAYSKLGQLDEAIQDFTKAIALSADNAQALANRGNAYQLQQRHEEALKDFAEAVVLDSKYATSYCVQRGQVESGRGNFRQALADYAIALKIDPNSRSARAAQATAQIHSSSDFVVESPVEAVSVAEETQSAQVPRTVSQSKSTKMHAPAAITQPVIEVTDVEDESSEQGAAETQLAIPTDEAVTPEQQAEYEAEQQRVRDIQREERLRLLAEKAQEIRIRNAAEEVQRKTADKKKKRNVRRDPEEVAAQWRRYKKYSVIAVGVLFLLFYGIPFAWSLLPPSKNPYKEVAAEKLIEEYVKDPIAADDQFADKTIVVRGKVKIVRAKVGRGQIAPPPKVYFEIADNDKVIVECLFDDIDVISDMRVETEYKIAGHVQKYKAGSPITLKHAQIREPKVSAGLPTSGTQASARDRELRLSKCRTFDAARRGFANLDRIFADRPLGLPNQLLEPLEYPIRVG